MARIESLPFRLPFGSRAPQPPLHRHDGEIMRETFRKEHERWVKKPPQQPNAPKK